MRFGINTFLFSCPFTNASTRLFPKFKKWGFQTVEIPIEDPSHIDPAAVKVALDKAGLACGSICACMGPGRDFRGTDEEQKTAMTYIKTLIDQAVVLGCPSIIGPIYSVVGKADAVDPAQQKVEWQLVVNNLKELAKYAEEKKIQLCIEPLKPVAKKCPANVLPPVFGMMFMPGPPTSVSPRPPDVNMAISDAFSSCAPPPPPPPAPGAMPFPPRI